MTNLLSKTIKPFSQTLSENSRELRRLPTTTLQINMGLACNQECRHCHLEAGPLRSERMTADTVSEVIAFIQRGDFQVVDITGGAPELNPNLSRLIEASSPLVQRVFLRSNLTALHDGSRKPLIELLRRYKVIIFASLPSTNGTQAELQRGQGSFEKSIQALQSLNALGYGLPGSDLELNLAVNPVGAFLPPSQDQTEQKFRLDLERKWGVTFNHLFTFVNVPLGRFRHWLDQSNNLVPYLEKLVGAFNPSALEKVMCRTTISVSWNGFLFDCDFNQSQGLFMGGKKIHLSEMKTPLSPGTPVAVSDHCYACTAGAGFTCGGAICS
jgi:radical SAM/Cys-rich protein